MAQDGSETDKLDTSDRDSSTPNRDTAKDSTDSRGHAEASAKDLQTKDNFQDLKEWLDLDNSTKATGCRVSDHDSSDAFAAELRQSLSQRATGSADPKTDPIACRDPNAPLPKGPEESLFGVAMLNPNSTDITHLQYNVCAIRVSAGDGFVKFEGPGVLCLDAMVKASDTVSNAQGLHEIAKMGAMGTEGAAGALKEFVTEVLKDSLKEHIEIDRDSQTAYFFSSPRCSDNSPKAVERPNFPYMRDSSHQGRYQGDRLIL